ncbi:9668_t:CDS:2, partial [Gigaspora margarita]
STDTGSLMIDEDPVQTNLQTDKDQVPSMENKFLLLCNYYREIKEAKLEEVKDITVPVYAKSEIYAQGSAKNEIIFLTINMDTTNPKKAIINMVSNIELPTFPSVSNSLIAKREPYNKSTLDNPFSKQHPEEDTSTRSSDIVMETTKKEIEFTIVINKKKRRMRKI